MLMFSLKQTEMCLLYPTLVTSWYNWNLGRDRKWSNVLKHRIFVTVKSEYWICPL